MVLRIMMNSCIATQENVEEGDCGQTGTLMSGVEDSASRKTGCVQWPSRCQSVQGCYGSGSGAEVIPGDAGERQKWKKWSMLARQHPARKRHWEEWAHPLEDGSERAGETKLSYSHLNFLCGVGFTVLVQSWVKPGSGSEGNWNGWGQGMVKLGYWLKSWVLKPPRMMVGFGVES